MDEANKLLRGNVDVSAQVNIHNAAGYKINHGS